jgi:uncharacterized spore protein YtfJ
MRHSITFFRSRVRDWSGGSEWRSRRRERSLGGGNCRTRGLRPYSVLILASFSRLAVMDSRTEFAPLIHVPPSRRRDWRISSKGP